MRPRGFPKTGGRAKGTRNKATLARLKAIEESGLSSLGYLQSVYRDERVPQQARIECAKAAAPFEFPRLATSEPKTGPLLDLQKLTDDELDLLLKLVSKASGCEPIPTIISLPENGLT